MNEEEIGKVSKKLALPVFALIIILLISQILNALYYAFSISPSGIFELLYRLGLFIVIAWWFKEDCKKRKMTWVFDMGFFLLAAWFFIIPFYLFRTRGIRAFITILGFIGIYAGTYLISLIAYFIVFNITY